MNFTREIIFLLILIIGNLFMYHWRKRQVDPDTFFFGVLWSFTCLFGYLGIVELQVGSFYLAVPLFFLAVFLAAYFHEKRRLVNGLLFNLFLFSFGAYLVASIGLTQNIIVGGLLAVILVAAVLLLMFGVYALLIFLYWNGIVVMRREAHTLANLLTLGLAIAMTVLIFVYPLIYSRLPQLVAAALSFIPFVVAYFSIVFYNFLTVSVLYQFNHPKLNQDYIIVLGAGLLAGERVSPLLAKRIDTAIKFYHAQRAKGNQPPKLLMSGGQGADEKISEAQAMKNYALSQGIPTEDILLEDRSTTTLENMRFSKQVMLDQAKGMRAIFASNNYHIFRAGIYARWAGLKADGIGAPTAFYYLPNAFLREYIAIIMLNKKRHAIIAGLIAFSISGLMIFATLISK